MRVQGVPRFFISYDVETLPSFKCCLIANTTYASPVKVYSPFCVIGFCATAQKPSVLLLSCFCCIAYARSYSLKRYLPKRERTVSGNNCRMRFLVHLSPQ